MAEHCEGNHRDTIVAAVGISADGDQNTVGQAVAELATEPIEVAASITAAASPKSSVQKCCPGWEFAGLGGSRRRRRVEARAAACQIDTLRRTADDA